MAQRPDNFNCITLFVFNPCITLFISGVIDYLSTEISTSKQKKFPVVTFVDTPGLVDGDMKYPFNVDDAIVTLGVLGYILTNAD